MMMTAISDDPAWMWLAALTILAIVLILWDAAK